MNQPINADTRIRQQHCTPAVYGDCELHSEFQPIISPTHRRVIGLEGLTRPSRHGRQLSPGTLFTRAAQEGEEPALDLALWQQFLQIYARADPNAWLFLNLSAASVGDPRTSPEALAELVHNEGLSCSRIVLEIVEDAIRNQEVLEEFVAECRDHGFRVAIDDFGAGDAHFERIWRIKPDIVKMDRTMAVQAAKKPSASRILMSLIRMIRENGSLVLLEGLETLEQAALAWHSDADFYQGFWYSRPAPLIENGCASAENSLGIAERRFAALSEQQEQRQIQTLQLLRHEVLATCNHIAKGISLAEATKPLFECDGVKRCYLLDIRGIQRGETVMTNGHAATIPDFNPLDHAEGASWSHREYFKSALSKPGEIHLSRPYVALPDTARTITISHMTYTSDTHLILCLDIHPEEAFPGSDHQLPNQL